MNTRRFPRTMQEAFGPYTSRHIDEPQPRTPLSQKVIYVLTVIACVVIVLTGQVPA